MAEEEIPRDATIETEEDISDDGSDFDQNPTLFVLSGVDTGLDEIVLEDCLTKVLSNYDISNDEKGDDEEDEENFLPSILVTLLETDYDDEKGKILFCVDRSLVVIGEEDLTDEDVENINNQFDEDVLKKIREYVVSDEAKTGDPVWIQDGAKAVIEIVQDDDVKKMTEEEAYGSWLKHNESEGGDNTLVVPDFEKGEEEKIQA
mmetsp:Transcript_25790/g.60464  ORF Transcript_25790/g.60464 Transcript_25790/m.60464 type:complete len:204 (+) Transcript_25790:123-734(+)|eukprot:CAMPEP_0197194160 /NCGR_PEP_ID=MMETSP1423-20130617/28712_1 /TAXON_ID=476441 /ORGANISM="Pseudo-nitzschia heimii, Strain UNC1101" /LENGTH=203 /DNA_ID=CAMNT_0042647533 /DNA_START=44 /DNA_END=655 /DNA_ORIENTATION=+